MRPYDFKINSRVEFIQKEETYKTTIQDVVDDGFYINIPVVNGEFLTFNMHEDIELFNYVDDNKLFKLRCTVDGKRIDNGIPLYKLSLPTKVTKIQRRNFVRVDMIQPIRYSKKIGNEAEENKNMAPALLLDISGGGMRIKLKEELSYGDMIIAELKSDNLMIKAEGKVVRKEKSIDDRFIYGISFWQMDNKVREQIIKDVFTIMRKQREMS